MARLTGSSAVLLVADIERPVAYRLGFTCEVYGDPPDFIVANRDEGDHPAGVASLAVPC